MEAIDIKYTREFLAGDTVGLSSGYDSIRAELLEGHTVSLRCKKAISKSHAIEVFGGDSSSKGQSVWRHHNNTCMRALRWERNLSMEAQRFARGPRQRRKSISFYRIPGRQPRVHGRKTTRTCLSAMRKAIGAVFFRASRTVRNTGSGSWATARKVSSAILMHANCTWMATRNATASCAIRTVLRGMTRAFGRQRS